MTDVTGAGSAQYTYYQQPSDNGGPVDGDGTYNPNDQTNDPSIQPDPNDQINDPVMQEIQERARRMLEGTTNELDDRYNPNEATPRQT